MLALSVRTPPFRHGTGTGTTGTGTGTGTNIRVTGTVAVSALCVVCITQVQSITNTLLGDQWLSYAVEATAVC